MKIIRQRNRNNKIDYQVYFEWRNQPGAGFGFDCDSHGKVSKETEQLENYQKCVKKEIDVDGPYYREFASCYVEPAIGICDCCGEEVDLHGFTNTCDCGADYNMSGQRLASREFWGEETGENVSDILMVDANY